MNKIIPYLEGIINIRDLYDMFSKMASILVDLLNMGRMCLEKVDWIIEYAKKMYSILKKVFDKQNNNVQEFNIAEDVIKYYFSGVPYIINMYGKTPEKSITSIYKKIYGSVFYVKLTFM